MKVDYEEAVRAYEERLDTQLRGFAADDALGRWVPDPDPTKGLLSLFEAAADAGMTRLEVTVGASRERLDRARLRDAARALGELTITEHQDRLELTVRFAEVDAPAAPSVARPTTARPRPPEPVTVAPMTEPLHPSYRAAADARAVTHEGAGHDEAERAGEVAGARVAIVVSDGVIARARHAGAVGAVRGALDAWCAIVEGLPVEEALEHGVHRVMDALRDRAAPPPVPGAVTPRNASPLFAELLALSQRWTRELGAADSEYAPEPRAAWRALDAPARLARVQAALATICADLELDPSAVTASLRGETKVLVAFADEVPIDARRRALLSIERGLQERVEPTLVVEREARRDLNVLRRL